MEIIIHKLIVSCIFRSSLEVPCGCPNLSTFELNQIEHWLKISRNNEIDCLRIPARADLTNEDHWLDDNIINKYMYMIAHRPNGGSKVYAINSLFWAVAYEYSYDIAKSCFSKDVNIFTCDKVLVPICLNNHWCLGVVNPQHREIQLYDSNSQASDSVSTNLLIALENFLKSEWFGRYGRVNTSNWKKTCVSGIPKQENAYDCGVFTCTYAHFIARNQFDFPFSQIHMNYFRMKILFEICSGHMLN